MFHTAKVKSFKTDPSNDEITLKGKDNSLSFDDEASNRLKDDVLSLIPFSSISSDKSVAKETFQLNSGSSFFEMQKAVTNDKTKKRPYSKPCPKSKRKYRMESFNDDERNLDNELIGIVGSLNSDKNLDSDSSTEEIELNDTIIVDDDNPFCPQLNLSSDTNLLKGKITPSAFFNSSLKSYVSTDGSKHHTFAIERKKGNELKSSVPVFKEIMPSSFSKKNSAPQSSSLLSSSPLTKNNEEKLSESPKSAKKKKTGVKDSIAEVEATIPNLSCNINSDLCQNTKTLNYQSIYASMGLDEDLCDTEQPPIKISNSVPKENETIQSPEKLDIPSEIKIKTEQVSSPDACSKKINDKNENMILDGYHVSLTFEAESPSDDGEEEIPLVLLKNQKPTDMLNLQTKPDLNDKISLCSDKPHSVDDNNISDFTPVFIKRELIEDEIISESQTSALNNVSSISNVKNNTNTNSLPIKIKSEPVDAEYFAENPSKTNTSASSGIYNNQLFSCNSVLSAKSQKKESNIPKLSTAADASEQNSVLARLLQGKNSALTSINSTNAHISSNMNLENESSDALFTNSSPSELPNSTELSKSKSTKNSKKEKIVMNKALHRSEELEKSATQPASPADLSNVSSLIPDSLNKSNSASYNNNSLNTKDSNAPSNKKSNPSAIATKKPVIKIKKQVKKKSPKKSDPENNSFISETSINSNDMKTFGSQGKNATDSDTSVLEKESQINPSIKEREEKGVTEKDRNLDENLPITILIKRQKSDTDTDSSSFLCTNISVISKVSVESKAVNEKTEENNLDECQKNSFSSDKKDNNILAFETSVPQNNKRKGTGKKKIPKKKAKKTPLPTFIENEVITDFNSSAQITELESNSSVHDAFEESFTDKNEKGRNESTYLESAATSGLDYLSSQDDINLASSCGAQSEESMSSNSFQTSVSGDINSQSEINNSNSFSVLPKKKKRRQRSYGWYKKKKTKKERERSRKKLISTDEVAVQNPVSDMFKDPLLFSIKTPVVVIKSLNSEIHNIDNNQVYNVAEIQNDKNNSAEISNDTLENTSSSKTQKRRGNQSRKRIKARISFKNNTVQCVSENTLIESSVSETDKISDDGSTEVSCLSNELPNVSKENSKNHSLEKATNESNISSSYEKDSTLELLSHDEVTITESRHSVESNVITNREGKLFPSLNIQEFEKDIATFEALIASQSNRNDSSERLSQNISKSNLKTTELHNEDKSINFVKDTRENSSETSVQKACVNTESSDGILNNIVSIQSNIDIPVKQELNDDSINSVKQTENTSQINPFRAALFGQEATTDATKMSSIPPLISIKKEKDVESQSLHDNTISLSNGMTKQTDGLIPAENSDKICPVENSRYDISLNNTQNSHALDINTISLSIKKEVIDFTKSVSNNNAHSFRSQNDLIQQIHASSSKSSSNLLDINSKIDSLKRYLSYSQLSHNLGLQKKPLELLNNCNDDDEIQIIPKESTSKDTPYVLLSDDENATDFEKRNSKRISESDAITMSNRDIELNIRIKAEKDNSKTSSVTHEASNRNIKASDSSKLISTFSFLKSDQIQNSVDPSKVRTDVSYSNIACAASCVSEDPVIRETVNQLMPTDKYDEYYKHPFPPSLVYYKKRRNRSKIYERIDSKAWNLSIDEVESRLKHSENTMPQFGKKLGDIVKLEKYPVSKSEVECYHRILGVAPSHKLLSKCYLTTNQNFLADINQFNKFKQPGLETKDAAHLTINDILQGITESKMMSSTFDGDKNIIFDRDCPSAETKDSFDSGISQSTDKCVMLDKNIEQSNSPSLIGNKFNSASENAVLTSQNSSVSCTTSFEDASNNAVMNMDTPINTASDPDINSKSVEIPNFTYLQSSILANLNLPSKEVVNNLLNSTETTHLSTPEVPDIIPNSNTELATTTMNNEASLPNSYSHVELEVSEVNTNVSDTFVNSDKVFNIINLPVMELRKILETASSLQSSGKDNESLQSDNINKNNTLLNVNNLHSDNVSHDTIWKNKETFEYNHTQSIPVTNADSSENTNIEKVDSSPSVENAEEQIKDENSDDEYVDNEPIHYDSGNERSDSSTHENEEPAPLPQYKSKWEKIMERKSQELKEKEKINELYLKDCVPVSSRMKLQNKRNSVPNKVSQSVDNKKSKKMNEPEKNVNSKIQNKTVSKKAKEIKSKNKNETESEKIDKSQKSSKKLEKQTSETSNFGSAKKESPLKKNKNKETDEQPNLFVPDKLVKSSPVKKPIASAKSDEKNKPKRFYGNRVTNRGTFLTESNPAKHLSNIKIPKKKTSEVLKKSANVRSEEFHSMIKSPDIDINLPREHSKSFNKVIDSRKNSDEYKSPLSNASPSVTSHFIRTKRMRDRQNAYFNSRSHFAGKNDSQSKKTPLLPTPYSKPSLYLNDKTMTARNSILNTSSKHHYDEDSVNQNIPLLSPPLSTSSNLSSDSLQSNADPTKVLLQRIMSVFNNTNTTSETEHNVLPNLENPDVTWNNQYNVPYEVAEPSIVQNTNLQPNLSVDSIAIATDVFRNKSQVDSLNLQRTAIGSQPQPNINLPFNSGVPVNTSLTEILDPRRVALRLPSNMHSNSISSNNYTLTETVDPRRASLGLQPAMSVSTLSNSVLDPQRTAFTSQPNIPIGSRNTSFMNIPLSEPLDPRKTAQTMHQTSNNKKHIESPLNNSSQILNSPPYITPTSISQQPPRRATCLVPSHLKSLVGHETIETHNVRLLMLEWSVDWLTEQQKMQHPPPISNSSLKKVSSCYDSFEDYYNTYFPLMLLETWHRIYVSWTHLNQTAPFLCQITQYSVKNHYVSVECQTVFSTDNRRKGVFPDEGSIAMVKYSTKSNEYTIKILGYVTHVKTRRYNPVTDSRLCSSLPQQKNVNPDSLQVLTLTFMGAYNSEDIDKQQPVDIHILCSVKPSLKQNDAMLFINKSPLQRSILNPVADGLLTFSLTPRNSPEEKVNECVRDITKGILSPHPLPLLTVVRAKPESDRLNIIPLLIQKMKTAYKTKVLLCVRTVRALGDIAANICLQQSLKLVIINKRCDTNLQFQKYLLDELVAYEAKKMEEETPGEKNLKSDAYIKIRKQIIRDCDVILSLIRNSHDDFLDQTFHETESIAQMCCIVDEANLCTEPETLIPILHGISKLILIGDPDYTAKVVSKTASAYDFNQSFFQRAYDLDLLTE